MDWLCISKGAMCEGESVVCAESTWWNFFCCWLFVVQFWLRVDHQLTLQMQPSIWLLLCPWQKQLGHLTSPLAIEERS